MKKKIVAGITALMMTAGMAMFVGPASAGDKILVMHKGSPICVSVNARWAHMAHGDEVLPANCGNKKKVAKKKKKVAKKK